jgi:hypothetical protein
MGLLEVVDGETAERKDRRVEDDALRDDVERLQAKIDRVRGRVA